MTEKTNEKSMEMKLTEQNRDKGVLQKIFKVRGLADRKVWKSLI